MEFSYYVLFNHVVHRNFNKIKKYQGGILIYTTFALLYVHWKIDNWQINWDKNFDWNKKGQKQSNNLSITYSTKLKLCLNAEICFFLWKIMTVAIIAQFCNKKEEILFPKLFNFNITWLNYLVHQQSICIFDDG